MKKKRKIDTITILFAGFASFIFILARFRVVYKNAIQNGATPLIRFFRWNR